jgi:hypothetical protein
MTPVARPRTVSQRWEMSQISFSHDHTSTTSGRGCHGSSRSRAAHRSRRRRTSANDRSVAAPMSTRTAHLSSRARQLSSASPNTLRSAGEIRR